MSLIKSLSRGLQILDLLTSSPNTVRGVTELADHLGVNKSSASRLVRTLAAHGYVERDPGSRAYRVGPKLAAHRDLPRTAGIRDVARPFIFPLMIATGECAHTAVASRGHALIVDDVESAASLRVSGGIGRLNMSHCTAVGKCLLAFGSLPLPDELPRRMPDTITDPDVLVRHLGAIRRQGYALDDEENEPGVRCLAAPVFAAGHIAVGCVGISGPTVRMTHERIPDLASLVIETAREITAVLTGSAHGDGAQRPSVRSAP